jgi:hypothetical protein
MPVFRPVRCELSTHWLRQSQLCSSNAMAQRENSNFSYGMPPISNLQDRTRGTRYIRDERQRARPPDPWFAAGNRDRPRLTRRDSARPTETFGVLESGRIMCEKRTDVLGKARHCIPIG